MLLALFAAQRIGDDNADITPSAAPVAAIKKFLRFILTMTVNPSNNFTYALFLNTDRGSRLLVFVADTRQLRLGRGA